jgi:hypothetical protein
MTSTIVTCDSCETTKKASNHWLKLWVSKSPGLYMNYDPEIEVHDKFIEKDFCGQVCLIKEIQRITRYEGEETYEDKH